MAVVWWPYLYSMEASLEVLSHLAPFERGIYEDYVANFWCTTSVIVKWKRLFGSQSLRLLSLAATISSCIPSVTLLILAPSKRHFLYGLLSSALSFYFSQQIFAFAVKAAGEGLPELSQEGASIFVWCLTQNADCYKQWDKLVLPYEINWFGKAIAWSWLPEEFGCHCGLTGRGSNYHVPQYFLSFQMHEKSILLPLLPTGILREPFIFCWLTSFAMLYMFPLLRRDELVLPYSALYGLFIALYYAPGGKLHRSQTNNFYASLKSFRFACSLILHVVYLMSRHQKAG